MVTSNHIHLLVFDGGERDVIPKSIQLVAGRTGQEYNQRKNRNGAFWEDRYHATAVSSDLGSWTKIIIPNIRSYCHHARLFCHI
jgi:putative transposase